MFFDKIETIEELKKEFIRLMKIYHPDKGGSAEECVQIQYEYEIAEKRVLLGSEAPSEANELSEELKNIIKACSAFEGVEIEIIGCWIWISGNTKEYKEILKSLKFKWSQKKFCWYYREEKEGGKRWRKSSELTLDDIRFKYGSNKIKEYIKLG